jgi:uncharacterized protein
MLQEPFPEPHPGAEPSRFTPEDREALLRVARDSISHGLKHSRALKVQPAEHPPALQEPGATFVTLELGGVLRVCVGSLEPRRPLVVDVALNAFSAAFHDFRFPPLSPEELPDLELHVSVLRPPVPLEVGSRQELLRALRPGTDGLVLEDPPFRSTFLPQVWESLQDPEDFLRELLLKAGLPGDHWSPTVRFRRYGVEEL